MLFEVSANTESKWPVTVGRHRKKCILLNVATKLNLDRNRLMMLTAAPAETFDRRNGSQKSIFERKIVKKFYYIGASTEKALSKVKILRGVKFLNRCRVDRAT